MHKTTTATRLAIASAAALAMVLPLGACGSDGASGGQTRISFYSFFKENQIGDVIEGFEKANPDIKIDAQFGQDPAQYQQTLQTRLAGGEPPTIFNMTMDNRTDIMDANQALDISGEDFLDGIDESNFTLFSRDGKTYGMPVSAWIGMMFYNKDILAKYGYDTIPATWDEFIEMGKKIDKGGDNAFLEDLASGISPTFSALLASYYESEGNDQMDETIFNGDATFSDEWTKPLEEWNKAIKAGVIPTKTVGLSGDQIKQEFLTGNLAVMRSGPWDLNDMRDSVIKFGVAAMPAYGDGDQWINGGPDQGFAISAKASEQEQAAAKKFLSYLNSEEGLKLFTTQANTTSISDKYRNEPAEEFADLYKDYFNTSRFYWVNWAKGPTAMSTEIIAQQQQMVQGKSSAADVAKAMDAKWAEVSK